MEKSEPNKPNQEAKTSYIFYTAVAVSIGAMIYRELLGFKVASCDRLLKLPVVNKDFVAYEFNNAVQEQQKHVMLEMLEGDFAGRTVSVPKFIIQNAQKKVLYLMESVTSIVQTTGAIATMAYFYDDQQIKNNFCKLSGLCAYSDQDVSEN